MSDWNLTELFRIKIHEVHHHQVIRTVPRPALGWLGVQWFCTLFGEVHPLWAQSDLDQDNAQIQEQIQATQHPLLAELPDRWENLALDLPWTIQNRLPWNKSLRALAMDTLGLRMEQCLAMDSLVRTHGRPYHPTFWLMLPWMESRVALSFHEALHRAFPIQELPIRALKSGMDVLCATLYERPAMSNARAILEERWQYRLRQQYRNIGWAMTIEKPADQGIAELPGFFVQGRSGKMTWLFGDFHPQSGNRLLGNTQRIPAFANPWAHIPGSESPFASSRMYNGKQARGFSLQGLWATHLIALNSYALGTISRPFNDSTLYPISMTVHGSPRSAIWMNSLSWEKKQTWGIIGLQFALPSALIIPASWNSSFLTTQIIRSRDTLTPVQHEVNMLKTMGLNCIFQKRNYFFQSNVAIRPSNPNLTWNKVQQSGYPVLDHILSWDFSHLHTLVMTPHPRWSLGMRWTKLSQGSEALRIFSITFPTEGVNQSLELNTQWFPVPYWSITFRSQWEEEGPDQQFGNQLITWNRGLEGRIIKGPFKDTRYTMIYKQAGRGRQGDYLFQYLRMPWPIPQHKGLSEGMSGYVQIAHGFSNPHQQTWVIAYNLLWKRVFRTQADLKVGQTWAISGTEGESVTVREDQCFGTGWWTGSSEQYRFTASLQGRSGGNGWRLWVRRIEDDVKIRWEIGFTYSQRWNEN